MSEARIPADAFQPEETEELAADLLAFDQAVEHLGTAEWERPTPRYAIPGANEADWAVRKLAEARAALEETDAVLKAEVARLADWAWKVNKPHNRDVIYFEAILRNWHNEQLTASPDDAKAWKNEPNKSINLPGGTLSMAKNPASIEVDNDVFLPWALANQPEWVKVERVVTRTPIKAEIKKALEDGRLADPETGEKVPGVTVKAAELRWSAVTE